MSVLIDRKKFFNWLSKEAPCNEAIEWLRSEEANPPDSDWAEHMWHKCQNGPWMVWLLERVFSQRRPINELAHYYLDRYIREGLWPDVVAVSLGCADSDPPINKNYKELREQIQNVIGFASLESWDWASEIEKRIAVCLQSEETNTAALRTEYRYIRQAAKRIKKKRR